jgi:peroxiredoxin
VRSIAPTRNALRARRLALVPLLLAVLALIAVSCGSDDGDGGGSGGGASSPFGQAPPEGSVEPGEPGEPLPAFDPRTADMARGRRAPEVTGPSLTGEEVTIGAPGRAQVVVFLAHWCPHCQAEVPRVVEHLGESPLPDDVDLFGVATSTAQNRPNYPPSEWLEREGWTFPTLDDADNTVQGLFGLTSFPFFAAIDEDGVIVARGSGELTTDEFDQLVEAARTGSL